MSSAVRQTSFTSIPSLAWCEQTFWTGWRLCYQCDPTPIRRVVQHLADILHSTHSHRAFDLPGTLLAILSMLDIDIPRPILHTTPVETAIIRHCQRRDQQMRQFVLLGSNLNVRPSRSNRNTLLIAPRNMSSIFSLPRSTLTEVVSWNTSIQDR